MRGRRLGLRVRLLLTLLGAVALALSATGTLLLLQLRAVAVQTQQAGTARNLQDVAAQLMGRCGQGSAPERSDCADRVARAKGMRWLPEGCDGLPPSSSRRAPCVSLPAVGGGLLSTTAARSPVLAAFRDLLSGFARPVVLGLGLLVLLLYWALERAFVAPLGRIDAALDRVGRAETAGSPGDAEGALESAGADPVGRVVPAVHRLDQRLREERQRVQAQIRELRAANEALQQAREGLARSERLASVGRLAAGVAHEVGNPVSAVIAYAALLDQRLAGQPEERGLLERLSREASRIDRILRDLLDLARPAPNLRPLDVGAALRAAAELLQGPPGKPAPIVDIRLPTGLPWAFADEHYLIQVFLNLFANSSKAGAARIEVGGRRLGDQVVLEIADDGSGLPADHAGKLFEPFFTTKMPGEGTGLGLALCFSTLESFGGSISARPREPGPGAVFEVRLRAGSVG